MRRTFVLLVMLILTGVLGQVTLAQNAGPTELERERLIRIVEPVIYPMWRLQDERWDWGELSTSCGLGHANALKTELGQAWIQCEADRVQRIAYHGPNHPEDIWGNMTIKVTVQGFSSHERLCWLSDDVPGLSDTRQYCDEKKPGRVKAVVIAHFTMKTTLVRYDEKEAKELTAANLRRGQMVTSAGIFEPRRIEAGEVKSREVVISPVKYEFLSGK